MEERKKKEDKGKGGGRIKSGRHKKELRKMIREREREREGQADDKGEREREREGAALWPRRLDDPAACE